MNPIQTSHRSLMKQWYYTQVHIPEMVSLEKKKNVLVFSGPLGSSSLELSRIDPLGLGVYFYDQAKQEFCIRTTSSTFLGLFRTLVNTKIQGVTRGYLTYLRIHGLGYRVLRHENTLLFKLGYSHDILLAIPEGIRVFLYEPTFLCLFGIDKNQVNQIAAKIRDLRSPSVYKGKGIQILPQVLRMKQGKRK